MNTRTMRQLAVICSGLLLACCATIAAADDTEIFFNGANGGGDANVMLILDTSGSMNDVVTSQVPYDSTQTYAADKCASSFSTANVYYGTGGTVPACGSTASIPLTSFKCVDAKAALATGAGTAAPGFYSGTLIQWGQITTGKGTTKVVTKGWQKKLGDTAGTDVECKNDAGVAGNGVTGGTLLWPSKNNSAGSAVGVWDVAANSWWSVVGNTGSPYVIYSANYLNYYYNSTTSSTNTKVAVLQQGVASILSSVSNVNIGLMRYDARGAGGMVLDPVLPIATNAAPILANVNADAPSGSTPISESLYEAYLYYSGGGVYFGNNSYTTTCNNWVTSGAGLKTCASFTTAKQPSVAASRTPATATGANYNSPSNSSCQKNFVVFLTDGLPNSDSKANSLITKLPNFAKTAGSCYASASAMYASLGVAQPSGTDGSGLCSAAMTAYMYKNDLRPSVASVQNVTTYFIGFGNDFADSSGAPTASFDYLQDAAAKGGGQAFTATNLADLTSAFNTILGSVVKTNTLFSAPAVAVNAFNRTQTLNDIYVSVFSPQTTFHWPGNVKHYKVLNGIVVDANNAPAVDPATGFFLSTAQSIWSAAPDGFDVTQGGAASNIPNYASRNVYTYIGANPKGAGAKVPLTGSANVLFNAANTLLTPTVLKIGATGDPTAANLISWARGQDLLDENSNGSTTDMRQDMGDPIHTAPAVIIYGKNADGTDNTVAFAPTNDGYLHAINANTGVELWSFIPQEMLGHLIDLYKDQPTATKHYGIDGAITVLKYDINGDGTIDPVAGDRAIIYFSTGRNADVSVYYAVDVTNQNAPVLLWAIDGSTLPGLGQSYSQPQLTRVNISGATQNSQQLTLVIGGGYDPAEDGFSYLNVSAATPEAGSHLYMIDALYGTLLWDAGSTATYNFVNTRMDHAIPANVAVIDLNADGYADRLYVGDMAGQLWRFDIWNGQPVATLVTGGVIASLGARDVAGTPTSAARRFFNMPDVSMDSRIGVTPFINIAIGSGYRSHPLDTTIQDRFYGIRDTIQPFSNMGQVGFDARTAGALIRDASAANPYSVTDITLLVAPVLPSGSVGWQLDLNQFGGWVGEKSLSSSTTLAGTVIFTTYSPSTTVVTDPCAGVGSGTNRVYFVDVFDGAPTLDRNKDGTITTADRSTDLAQGGIAPQPVMLFLPDTPGSGNSPPPGATCTLNCTGGQTNVTLLIGAETVNVTIGQLLKTYWRDASAN